MARKLFRSMVEAEQAYVSKDKAATLAQLSLHDMAKGKGEWVTIRPYRAYVSRVHSACGGVITVCDQHGNVNTHYLEEWTRETRQYLTLVGSGSTPEQHKEWDAMWHLISTVNLLTVAEHAR